MIQPVIGKCQIDRKRKGLANFASPSFLDPIKAGWRSYLAPAAAATAGVPTLTLICFGLASSRFGMNSVKTPFR
jgi:hypothetical protein